jgi:carbamate kinase
MGIEHELTIPYEHEQAGLAESTNRVIIDKARTMLIFKGNGPKVTLFKLQFLLQTDCGTMAVKVSHMKNSPGEKQMLKCYGRSG